MLNEDHNSQQTPLFLTLSARPSSTARQHLKGSFLNREKCQAQTHIRDLERTVEINKGIICELISSCSPNESVLRKLNEENLLLMTRLNEVQRERDDCQGRLLITEQLLEEIRDREDDVAREHDERIAELLDQLSHKEYVLQLHARCMNKMQSILRNQARQTEEVRTACDNLGVDVDCEARIENVVEENEGLKVALENLRAENRSLRQQIADVVQEGRRRSGELPSTKKTSCLVSGGEFSSQSTSCDTMTSLSGRNNKPTTGRSASPFAEAVSLISKREQGRGTESEGNTVKRSESVTSEFVRNMRRDTGTMSSIRKKASCATLL